MTKAQRYFRHKHKRKRIAKFILEKKSDFEQDNDNIQVVFEITAQDIRSGEIDTHKFNIGAWDIYGGKYQIRKSNRR